jgi:phosphatidylglycerophosphatase C
VEVTVAVFDVDNTLTVRDCVVPFVVRVAGPVRVAGAIVRNIGTVVPLMARRDRDGLKLLFVRELFAGRSVDEVDNKGIDFASHIADNWMREDTSRRLRWHQAEGHVVVLVSASLSPYLIPLGDLLEVDAVLCATLAEHDGAYTGELVGPNCRGIEKVNRITEWCRDAGINTDNIRFAYGDSSGDTQMLAMAAHGEWVGKSEIEMVPQ